MMISNSIDAELTSLRVAEETRCQFMLSGNTSALNEQLSDTLVYVHSTGTRDSKQSYIQKIASALLRYESLEFSILSMTILGKVGLVDAVMKATVLNGDIRRDVTSSYLAVWEKNDSRWKLQALQATPLPITP